MHASDEFVASWKTDVIRKALISHGLDTEIRKIVTSPAKSRRRAKLSGTRTKKGALVGFHGRASQTIVNVDDCKLLMPGLLDVLSALREMTTLSASRKSEVQFTVTQTLNGPDVFIDTEKDLSGELRMQLAGLAQQHKLARLSWNDEIIAELLPPHQKFGEAQIKVPPGVFLQATEHGQDVLIESVTSIVGSAKRVVDLFSGCGTFALPIAKSAELHAVEGEQHMLDALDDAWRHATGLKNVTTEKRDLFRRPLEADELSKFDAAIIDPPRAGAKAQIQTLTQAKLVTIAMVSCNPVTFARDAKQLVDAGYNFDWLMPVDQFRWSSHIELVGAFSLL
jgi:23S rRNA (uracil1939-C5)-methyltransferase